MNNKLLLVDDDEGILDALSLLLEEEGYIVKTTPKSDEVFRYAKDWQPHVIILDILLSGKDGREICKHLKSQEETKHIPVLMFSAHPTAQADARKSGADDFLAKPFETELLLDKIKMLLKP